MSKKISKYYSQVRLDLLSLIKNLQVTNVLEIGCGQGLTLKYLKTHHSAQNTYGIEINSQAADIARQHVDHLINADIENSQLPKVKFDLILLPDVLEHLHDPEALLTRLHHSLTPNGILIISIPNIQHFTVLKQLLLGRWDYTDSGILDRTHLHFFTKQTIQEMLKRANYQIIDIKYNGGYLPGWKGLLNFFSGNRLRPWFVSQWLIKTKKGRLPEGKPT